MKKLNTLGVWVGRSNRLRCSHADDDDVDADADTAGDTR